ncbi:MAG: MATE family efflux transporter, partial [Clostridia bacterium]|nr:MATE family efflux transporter [Clostridia bacterium]
MQTISINHKKLPLGLWDGAFWRTVLALAIPIALQNILTASFSLVDTLMVGQLGTVALSSVGMAGQWSWLLNMMLFGICSGASVFVSQYWGNKNTSGIQRVIGIT